MDNTIIQQGYFTSTGANVTLPIRSGVTWINTYNYSQYANGTGTGQLVDAQWLIGMANGTGLGHTKTATTLASLPVALSNGAGFTLVDTTLNQPIAGAAAISAISTAATPVVSTASTAGLSANTSVVRIINVPGASQLGGIDFTIGTVVTNTSFTLAYMSQLAAAGTPSGSYYIIPYDPIFYPTWRVITNITSTMQCVVTLSVTHGYTVGQEVRLSIADPMYGSAWNQIDGTAGEIVAINTTNNTITLNINTSSLPTFVFPPTNTSNIAFTPARIVPFGEGTDSTIANPNLLDDATVNNAFIGITLAGGAGSPAGSNLDVIYWKAGTSFGVNAD